MKRAEVIHSLNAHLDMYVAHSASRDLVGSLEALGELVYCAQSAMKTLGLKDSDISRLARIVKASHYSLANQVPPTVAIRSLTNELCNCTK